MAGELILDTGPLVALIDRSEQRHDDCVGVLERWSGPLLTTEAVLTETLHLLGPGWPPRRACVDFVLRGAVILVPSSLASLGRARELMHRYSDLALDFADATLVALAEEVQTDRVFTLDRRDFQVLRMRDGGAFRILP